MARSAENGRVSLFKGLPLRIFLRLNGPVREPVGSNSSHRATHNFWTRNRKLEGDETQQNGDLCMPPGLELK